jgi:high frequency lysogenization protein
MTANDRQQRIRQQTLALAAIIQSVTLVDQVARTGQADPQAMESSLASLFITEATTAEAAFKGVEHLQLGIRSLRDMLSGNDYGERQNIIRYCLGVMHLQRKLASDGDTSAILRSRLAHTEKQREFTDDVGTLCSALSGIYQDTLSKYRFRIQISGSAQQLQNPANAARVRALLLAAVRAAFLWRQAGGKRFTLLFRRQAIFACTKDLLSREILH